MDRIPAYATRVVQDDEQELHGPVLEPQAIRVARRRFRPSAAGDLLIYEPHVGMKCRNAQGVGTYDEFTDLVLPRIRRRDIPPCS